MPLIFEKRNAQGGIIAGWELNESSDELLQLINLSDIDTLQLQSFKIEKRRKEWLATRLLVQMVTNEQPEIKYQPNGQPLLIRPQYHISISHTQDIAVIALHPKHKVAIDVEMINARVGSVANRFISEEEEKMISNTETLLWQTIIWSAKEALFKWWGEKEVDFKKHMRILPFVPSATEPFKIDATVGKTEKEKSLTLQCEYTQSRVMVYHI